MAKRRAKTKTVTRYVRAKTKRRSSSKGIGKIKAFQIDAMIYGAAREKISSAIAPLISQIPLGSIADEIGMGLINYFLAKNTKGMARNIALKGLVIENARLGEALISGQLGSLMPNSGNASTFPPY